MTDLTVEDLFVWGESLDLGHKVAIGFTAIAFGWLFWCLF
ncbi:putative membrane protein [Rhizobium phage Pasto]|uniref:Putative membrane protein n=1 Tax=Rhizobium phage Pasto TaxID=2767575 RepID=A0A7S6R6X5_9CAUD|nr:putative membrane protein [Rhizobium phage Pasto]